ncbi:hypothetical protein H8K52_09745 [Undibacterium seohonense]|uniref:Peptidase A24A N-terminal domain-containing protein n=1 Tax=Undibacterium seohonense TaxID=1344950 RepID=A0ABR6X3Z5_9BURK|nr:hypothetical protein [Undibacterium seohonense]MBC3807624.1 hypothetical protein [Undibacterium seohonense]
MYACPHCHLLGVSYLHKWRAHPAQPATCTHCAQLSDVSSATSNAIFSVGCLLILLSCTLAFSYQSWLVGIIGALGSICCYGYGWHVVPLRITSHADAEHAKKISWTAGLLAALASLFH